MRVRGRRGVRGAAPRHRIRAVRLADGRGRDGLLLHAAGARASPVVAASRQPRRVCGEEPNAPSKCVVVLDGRFLFFARLTHGLAVLVAADAEAQRAEAAAAAAAARESERRARSLLTRLVCMLSARPCAWDMCTD